MNLNSVFAVFCIVAMNCSASQAVEVSGLIQTSLSHNDNWQSYQNQGTGIVRFEDNQINLQQAMLRAQWDVSSAFSVDVVANYYEDGEQNLGFTQAQILYKPISQAKIRYKARAGFFYPRIFLENIDTGWLSPYTYTQSAINSWIGEELRIAGMELSLFSPGRVRRSPWSWEVTAAVFKGNDPLGTLLSWRGFAMHDRQSLHNDRVAFAPYPSVIDEQLIWHPNFVEPFHELDGKLGTYVGVHVNYFNQSTLRYYYYDNRADPLEVNDLRLYACRTKFHALSWQHNLSKQTRFISQWLSGSSVMGNRFVFINFDAWYLMVSHSIGEHRLSLRYDRFIVQEDDDIPADMNSSDGLGVTLAWRYDINANWQIGLEQHFNQNSAQNRIPLDLPIEANQHQSLLVMQFRW
ncbi:hypothetical protein [Aliiglaciecola sp. LCG003]|uniref:hypothetical protein n=1 Tax=Aliiglaciecola sp. LCG003 TaxID=3053655 RepID=UPI0025732657|nr:hypothetical protein [Aliiglaciecola sp. LCG003]WJG10217.1 hypothetical protein QR722_04060 [Aliiglaciecola sp. LCG003]